MKKANVQSPTLFFACVLDSCLFMERLNFLLLLQENQKDLECATEQLSEYLERDITSEMLVDIKQKVQDKYR